MYICIEHGKVKPKEKKGGKFCPICNLLILKVNDNVPKKRDFYKFPYLRGLYK